MRLTKKENNYYTGSNEEWNELIKRKLIDLNYVFKLEQKLGQLEDIEDELGIDLVTLFKAISNGIYVKTKNGISKHYTIHLMKWQQTNTYCLFYRPYSHIRFKDYGKTWALTKGELK